jgi:hypothetical protein
MQDDDIQFVLSWMFNSLGLFYGTVLPLAGFLIFVGACLVVGRNKRPSVIAAYLVFLPLPFLIGLFATFHGCILSYYHYSQYDSRPTHALELILGNICLALFSSLVGLALTFPSLLVLAFGLLIRTIRSEHSSNN